VIAQAGIGLTAVGAAHFCAPEAESFLHGSEPGEEVFAEAGRIAAAHCDPHADQRGPADYKRHLAAELTRRALAEAAGRI
jgi:carbon-monoxide dehydrogenase medium subunit